MPTRKNSSKAAKRDTRSTPATAGKASAPLSEQSKRRGPEPDAMDGDNLEDEEDIAADDEYVVEDILDHQFDEEEICKYLVKWKGYERRSDQTWEPIEHLEIGAKKILKAYHDKIGGKPVRKLAGTKRTREGNSKTPQGSASKVKSRNGKEPATRSRTTVQDKWKPPSGSWEEAVQAIDTIEQDGKFMQVYLHWENGKKTKHPIDYVYKKCPQKMLHFYEQHLVFREGDEGEEDALAVEGVDETGGDKGDGNITE
ncbi:MAG: hypothetical protein M1826_000631 [Phylliscum demangeonii]|nr:MAG: hypothetical protein M1826_000631 [Phylliscum demangeonii]